MLAHIAQWYPSDQVADKCLKKDQTVKLLLEWYSALEINAKDRDDNNKANTINRINYNNQNRYDSNQRRHSEPNTYRSHSNRGAKTTSSRPVNQYERKRQRCEKCNRAHGYGECPAFGKSCNGCGGRNHFQACCKQRENGDKRVRRLSQANDRDMDDEDENDVFITNNIHATRRIARRAKEDTCPRITLYIAGTGIRHVIDTGSDLNILVNNDFNQLTHKPKLSPSDKIIYAYDSDKRLEVLGQFDYVMTINGITDTMQFVVVDTNDTRIESLFGYPSAKHFGVIQIINRITEAVILQKYSKLFEDCIGKMKDAMVSIFTDQHVTPSQQAPYVIPFHMIPGTEMKLKQLVDDDIIERVQAGSRVSWVSPMLAVQKQQNNRAYKGKRAKRSGLLDVSASKIRITSDNKKLNKAIVRQPRPMPSVQSLSYDLNGKKVFSKIDIRDAFSTVELDEDSRQLTTFSTPWGLYRYKRLNIGLCVASELFQEVFSGKLCDLKNIKVAIDDVLVYGKDQEEHDFMHCYKG